MFEKLNMLSDKLDKMNSKLSELNDRIDDLSEKVSTPVYCGQTDATMNTNHY